MLQGTLFLGPLLIVWSLFASSTLAKSVSSTILVFTRDAASGYSATSGLNAYGIPYNLILVPSTGITLPSLNSSATNGNYGGIIVMSELAYEYSSGWGSAFTAAQWQQLYDYQTAFGVRMVRLDVYPTPDFGVTTTIPETGCCDAEVEQFVSFTNTSAFPTANLKSGAPVSTQGIWHYPASITNSSIAREIAQFAPSGAFTSPSTAAIINTFSSRQQMVWFITWATDWSATSNFLMHAHIHWMTRGLFVGRRRVYYSTQVDDMQLSTGLYEPVDQTFRLRTTDLDAHVSWQAKLNSRLPAGSSYQIEIGHNGNGNVEVAIDADVRGICSPSTAIEYDFPPDTALEFQKPLGTGTNVWPTTPSSFVWTRACISQDALGAWFMVPANRDAFAHISHTFTHLGLNNATYSDADKEIKFNVAWFSQTSISKGKFSPIGLIPPAITGLHNGDVIQAWLANGIQYVVGDSSRPALLNTQNEHWPLISTVAANGYAGLTIIPRWPTPIYYNCNFANCTLDEWVTSSGGSGNFSDLLAFSRATDTRHLLSLRHDSYMFHQANLRQGDTPAFTVGPQSGNLSLFQIYVETVLQEMMRLTTWPIISIQHDALGLAFSNRMTQDQCHPNLSYTLSNDSSSITGVTVTAQNNICAVPIPVTFPVAAKTSASPSSITTEQIGSDPLTIWTKLSGSPVSFTFAAPVAI